MLVGERAMKLGVALPLSDIGGDPATVRLFAQAAEAAGYDHLAAPDHVLGVNGRPALPNAAKWGRFSRAVEVMGYASVASQRRRVSA
jgi:hypothetical protein